MLAIQGFRDRPEHDPRRLPRRRVVPAPGRSRPTPRASRSASRFRPPSSSRSTTAGRVTEREVAAQAAHDRRQDRPRVARRSRSTIRRGAATSSASPGTDRFGNPIVADRALTISGKKDETKLRLLADRQRYKVGEEASVNLHSRDRAGTALLTWEADRILTYKLVTLNEGDNPVAWAVDGAAVPQLHAHRDADVRRTSSTRPGSTSRSSATCG